MMSKHVSSEFGGCFCKNVMIQEYQNQVAMKPPFEVRDCLGEVKPVQLVCVDACLASEIAWLWKHGIVTHGCCCGHGDPSMAYIGVYPEHIEKMKELGYKNDEDKQAVHPEQHFKPLTFSHLKMSKIWIARKPHGKVIATGMKKYHATGQAWDFCRQRFNNFEHDQDYEAALKYYDRMSFHQIKV